MTRNMACNLIGPNVEKKLVTIESSLALIWSFKMGPFILFSKYEQEFPFCHAFWTPEKVKKEDFNRHQFFPQMIKLLQNETNRWSIFLLKTKYW